jgi:hypothetical protein
MKTVWCVFGWGLLAVAGCDFLPTLGPATKPEPESVQAGPRAGKPHKLVAPEDVNEDNRREMAKLLGREMDQDEEEVTPAPAASAPAAPEKR